jgi:uncharacterized phiE125 gp8 family phage protein
MSLSNIGITGSVRVAEMIRDAVDGSDSVDILVVGDSNTLFASESGIASAGWTDGLQFGLFTAGAPFYATPIFPCGLDSNSQSAGWRCSWSNFDSSGFGYAGIGANGITSDGVTTATLLSGNTSGPAAITNQFKVFGAFGPAAKQGGTSSMDYGYYAATSPRYWDWTSSVIVDANNPMPIGGAFKYRVVHGVFGTGGGHFHQEQSDNGGITSTSQQVSCAGTADGIATAILDIAANGSRVASMRCAWGGKFAANRTSGNGMVGKAAVLLQSVTKASGKGASVSAMCWAGGNTATQIGAGAVGIGSQTWQTWLREARSRQVAAGGSGRVIVWFHAGANADTGVPESWVTAYASMVSIAKSAWATLGYPAQDLGFVAMPSHVVDSLDSLDEIRAHVNSVYADDVDTMVVDLGVIAPYSTMSTMLWYDNTSGTGGSATANVHLWGGGYESLSSLLIGRVLAYQDGGAVDLETVKTALKIDYDDDDDELERLIHAAESFLEQKTGVDFTPKASTMYLRNFRRTVFPRQPLQSATQVTYTSTAGVSTVLPTTSWWVDNTGEIAAIEFIDPPETKAGTVITVTYTSGHTDTPNEVVQAIISLVGHWYNNPEAAQAVGLQEVPLGFKYLVDQISNRAPFS